MRIHTAALLALAGLGAAAPAAAQFFQPPPQRAPPNVYPAPGGGYYYVPQQPGPAPQRRRAEPREALQPPPQPQPGSPGFSFRRLFGFDEPPPAPVQPERAAPRPRPKPVIAKPTRPKSDGVALVAVFGDGLAEGAGQGFADAYEDNPDFDVVRRIRGDGGLVRADVSDWPRIVQETLDQNPKIAVGVMMAGSNDRQPIREGDKSYDPLSERWREIYRGRVDAVVKAFQDRGLPLVWIGLPPMRNEKASADLIALNEIVRDRVVRGGGAYVDIWPGFVTDENRYAVAGPDIAGQPARLRGNDGVGFTRAGGRKVAFFADTEIKRLLEAKRNGAAVASLPAEGVPPAPNAAAPSPDPAAAGAPPAIPPDQVAAAPPPLPQPAAPVVPAKPLAGPVLPLNRPEVAPGGTLITARPKLDGDAPLAAQKTLRDGSAPIPRPGRADDFRWPRS